MPVSARGLQACQDSGAVGGAWAAGGARRGYRGAAEVRCTSFCLYFADYDAQAV